MNEMNEQNGSNETNELNEEEPRCQECSCGNSHYKEGEHFQFVENMRDRSINMDHTFQEFVNLANTMLDSENDGADISINDDGLIFVCEIKPAENIGNLEMFELKWAYSLVGETTILTQEKLLELNLPNNIDSVVEYNNGVHIPGFVLMGILGAICQQLGNVAQIIVFSETPNVVSSETTDTPTTEKPEDENLPSVDRFYLKLQPNTST